MPAVRSSYRSLLAALLLLLGIFAGRQHAAVMSERMVRTAFAGSESTGRDREPQRLVIALPGRFAHFLPGNSGSGNGHGSTGGKDPGWLPLRSFVVLSCAKSALKQRLGLLLEHYPFQQRLSLYPKHGFW